MRGKVHFLLILIFLLLPLASLAQQPPFQQVDPGGKIKVPSVFGPLAGPAAQSDFGSVVIVVLDIVLLVVGAIAVLFLIWGGFRYITAYGNEEQAEAAKRIIKQAVVGLIIVLLSFAIITIITRILVVGEV